MFKRFAVLLVLLLAFLVPITTSAQAATSFSSVVVSLWPAYDRPGVLVIYHLSLASTEKLPLELSIRIPKEVSEAFAVAYRDASGQLINIQYNIGQSGDWNTVNFTATQPELQIEYYDPRLVSTGQNHSFTFTWAGDYDVTAMTVEVQEPYGASNMRISPGNASTSQGIDGLTYFTKEVGHVAANQQFSLDIGYTKASQKLSVEDMPIQPTAPINTSPSLGEILRSYLAWILGGIGIAIIAGGGFWYWQSGRQAAQSPRKRHRSRAARTEPDTSPAESAIYCHQCGKRASASDIYCRSCGTRLRTEG